ncbi:MAG TPA: hypothetical protein VJY33_22170 [Isosphaeraceae bacterium]|nr:hypothetical protein [Isosphaeraceae bacterium]
MNLKLAICKKEGTTNYGSNGASAEVSIDLDPDFSIEHIGHVSALWHQALTAAVDSQLARMRTVPTAPQQQPEPDSGYIPRRQRDGQQQQPVRPERPIDPNRLRNDGGPWRGAGPPATGRELLGWARKHGRDKEVFDLGKAWNLPGRCLDWSADDVADVYATLNIPANGRG